MAHVLVLRNCPSFVTGPFVVLGPMEQIEQDLSMAEYPIGYERKGYCKPVSSKWLFFDYRVKQEAVSNFINDLRTMINLNPVINTITLKDIFFAKKNNRTVTAGKTIELVQWVFKWINRKVRLSMILLLIGLIDFLISKSVSLLIQMSVVSAMLFINPVKPAGRSYYFKKHIRKEAYTFWSYNYVFGQLLDIDKGFGEEL